MDFKKLAKENRQNINNIIKLITKEENEDLTQEVLIKVWKNQKNYEERGSVKGWISTIAKNISKDYLKSSARKVSMNSSSDDLTINSIQDKNSSPENFYTKLERQKIISNAIEKLKPKLKEVILLTEFEGYTYEECAKKLKCPIGTIKSRIYNAKKELLIELKDLL
ncbi:sigma-70 family RNA polymerase sigma factor [bacterium]|nr:sigma-70 family RNA polymerase sigma factor [bacterium]